ncbi:hypothetical protein KOW79_008785 [Hemibagrus wyckioides]|uniref:Uncharacterized protein n=1 Tax=Hemibagrus wyckioides TaxID=337641 RepID=A0A9D3NRY3_9TELE|nr:hypothetical protein KOW79_008785 [Hemibagrus wyckioides]
MKMSLMIRYDLSSFRRRPSLALCPVPIAFFRGNGGSAPRTREVPVPARTNSCLASPTCPARLALSCTLVLAEWQNLPAASVLVLVEE